VIALNAFAQAHAPLPEFPALCPAAVPLALPSIATAPVLPSPALPMALTPEALDDAAPVLTLYPSMVPMAFSEFLNPNDSIRGWLTAALPLEIAPFITEAEAVPVSPTVLPVVPSVTEAAPVVKKAHQPTSKAKDIKEAVDKPPRKRSPRKAATAG
jgi:hypothetical protein